MLIRFFSFNHSHLQDAPVPETSEPAWVAAKNAAAVQAHLVVLLKHIEANSDLLKTLLLNDSKHGMFGFIIQLFIYIYI